MAPLPVSRLVLAGCLLVVACLASTANANAADDLADAAAQLNGEVSAEEAGRRLQQFGARRASIRAGGTSAAKAELGLGNGIMTLLQSGAVPDSVSTIMRGYSDPLSAINPQGDALRTGLVNLNDDSWANVDLTRAALDAAILSLVGNSIQLATGPLAIVAKSISALGKAIKVPLEDWSRWTGRYKFLLSEYDFGQKLYNDVNSDIDDSDVLGDIAKYIKMYNAIQDAIAGDAVVRTMEGQVAELNKAMKIIDAVNTNPAKK
ncbi:hypothetical protein FOA52_010347 [Chlamydomonas sp. UWO 241]|nr:hypothetical protein FOA52_010347 [Chlamydomonas sp. UWO 241]